MTVTAKKNPVNVTKYTIDLISITPFTNVFRYENGAKNESVSAIVRGIKEATKSLEKLAIKKSTTAETKNETT